MRRKTGLIALTVAALFLSACAVKPDPISNEEVWLKAQSDKAHLYENQIPLSGPMTLSMAVARALTYNYDYRLAMMEGVFHQSELEAANLAMLPKLTASAGYTARNNENASRSISFVNRTETLEPSVSQERQRTIADLSFNWSALDFGISYFQAKQQADRYLIMKERERRVVNNIVKDVVVAFWRVAMAELISADVKSALRETEAALASYRQARKSGLEPLMQNLENEKRLLQISNGLKRVDADMAQARAQLAALVNLPSGEPYKIVIPDRKILRAIPKLPKDLDKLEDIALYMRSDLREDNYQERIDKNDVKMEILRMIPGLNLLGSGNYDSNKYSHYHLWAEGTARINADLLGLFGKYKQFKSAETKVDVAKTRHMANMVAAIVQVHLAYHQYDLALQDYQDNLKLSDIERQIYQITATETQDGQSTEVEKVTRHASLIAARLQEYHSLTSIYDAWGNLYFTLGGDLAGEVPHDLSLEEKETIIYANLRNWWAGDLPQPPAVSPETAASFEKQQQKEDAEAAGKQEKIAKKKAPAKNNSTGQPRYQFSHDKKWN